jgi:hypothetical protein
MKVAFLLLAVVIVDIVTYRATAKEIPSSSYSNKIRKTLTAEVR